MATGECLDEWPGGWPVCAENLLAWGTGGGVGQIRLYTVEILR